MGQPVGVGRREFTAAAVLAALSGVTITISGCGGGGGGGSPSAPSNPTPPTGPGDKAGSISGNHGHTAVITAAQLTAAAAVALDIRGQGDHPHTVTLSAAEVSQIAASQRVSKESSNEAAHTHTVTFN
jgi:hypothetical protein